MEKYILKINDYELRQKGYSNNLIIQIPSLYIKQGDIIFILGANGSGKSSILRSLFSFDLEGKNYIEVGEKSKAIVSSDKGFELDLMARKYSIIEMHQAIAYQGQNDVFNSHDNIIMAIASHAQAALMENRKLLKRNEYNEKYNLVNRKAEELAMKYLDDLYKYEKKYYKAEDKDKQSIALKILKKRLANQCSFGQQKMISILADYLKADIMESDLLVMDEPLNHLDAKNKKEVVELLSDYINERKAREHPLTLIIISHCLIFPFIEWDNCYQYQIIDKQLVKRNKKIYIDCLKQEESASCEIIQ